MSLRVDTEMARRDEAIAVLRRRWEDAKSEVKAALEAWEQAPRGLDSIRAGHAYQAARYAEDRAYGVLMDALRSDEIAETEATASARRAA